MESTDVDNLAGVKNIILVLSGKGGVGKSTVATQICLGLHAAGKKVGLLDVDLCGPSIPKMMNVENHDIHKSAQGWVPIFVDKEQRLSVMSIGFLLDNKEEAVIWRGPKKTGMITQFLTAVCWDDLDYLIIDTPPGTSDEHISVMENLKRHRPQGAIVVTTPQAVAVGDVRRELTFCRKMKIPILGIVENMSGFVCPNCSECTNIFTKGGGEALATQAEVPFLGCIPLDPQLSLALEHGASFLDKFPESLTRDAVLAIVNKVLEKGN